ncbi:MAG TPA: UDP-N-acetylglucosamine--N-acetylmuramyl-(pentapeptide) pyrophosphoryl-undecaprenol N-acetylglucosamine transferase [Gemmatimonadales bacterium]|nr:UDP-N-acetylglucosamine--N-acetylmuramyl-(pentapeptide) pyrophosphoryl-undecaprenol N-acetylglucosamine transferase [Gemmatimonadales bacterium]
MPVVLVAGGGTGGHLMPALAIAGELRARVPGLEPVLVGAERGVEAHVLPARDFGFTLLPAEPIYRRQWWRNAGQPATAIRVVRALRSLFARERPVAAIGTGGYASAPAVWWAARHGLPTAIQEQNAYPGLATRWLARRVDHVYLGLPEAGRYLTPGRHTRIFDTGNPILPPDPGRRAGARGRFGFDPSRATVLVTGGSQGALAINRAVAEWVRRGGSGGINLLWVTGKGTYAEFAALHAPPARQVVDFLDPMADGWAVADLVVSRAGMLSVAELCAWGLPSVLVPLPTAAADHQTRNAEAMESAGASVVLRQVDLDADSLAHLVGELLARGPRRDQMAAAALGRGRPRAVEEIVTHFLALPEVARAFPNIGGRLD